MSCVCCEPVSVGKRVDTDIAGKLVVEMGSFFIRCLYLLGDIEQKQLEI